MKTIKLIIKRLYTALFPVIIINRLFIISKKNDKNKMGNLF